AFFVEGELGDVADVQLVARGQFAKDQIGTRGPFRRRGPRRRRGRGRSGRRASWRRGGRLGPVAVQGERRRAFAGAGGAPDAVELGFLAAGQSHQGRLIPAWSALFLEEFALLRGGMNRERDPLRIFGNDWTAACRRPGPAATRFARRKAHFLVATGLPHDDF